MARPYYWPPVYGADSSSFHIYTRMSLPGFFAFFLLVFACLPVVYADWGPMIGTIETGSGLAAGIRANHSIFQAAGAYSFAGYQQVEGQIGWNAPRRGFFFRPIRYEYEDVFDLPSTRQGGEEINQGKLLYFEFRYRDLSQIDFFGVGPDSLHSSLTNFEQRDSSFVGVTGYQFSRKFRFAVRTGYTIYALSGGDDDDEPDTSALFGDTDAPGLAREPDFFIIGPAALLDLRDVPENPHSGGALGLSFTRFQPRSGDFAFSRYLFDARYFMPLRDPSRVAAFWFHTSIDHADRSNRVPFYLQQALGGSQMLRGFDNFRFRDSKLLYLSGEYRWEVKPAMEIAGFFDAGKVFSERQDFNLRNLRTSYGAGFRFKTEGGVVFRVDFARSSEENRIVFRFGPSF